MTDNNKSNTNIILNTILAVEGIPVNLHIWSIILEETIRRSSYCDSCDKIHSTLRRKRTLELLVICRKFNNLDILRKNFCRTSNFFNVSMNKLYKQKWTLYDPINKTSLHYVTLPLLISKTSSSEISNRIFNITWLDKTPQKGFIKWVYGRRLPIFFMATVSYLISESGEFLPKLKIPAFAPIEDPTPNAKYRYIHDMPKMNWIKTPLKSENSDGPSVSIKGKYHLLVLGSPYNLFEIDNMDFFQTKKVEPIGKVEGKQVCFLVYRIRSLWRYRIFLKSDIYGKYPIYFRTNML
jgi:hypothetical protein